MLIVVSNLKGGSGKTTWSCEIAGHFGMALIDLDPQGDASIWARTKDRPHTAPHPNRAAAELAAARGAATWMVADCPPAESKTTVTALQFAQVVVVPVRGGPQDLQGWGRMKTLLQEVRQRNECKVGIIANAMRPVGTLDDVLEVLKAEHRPRDGVYYLGAVGLRQAATYAYLDGDTVSGRHGDAGQQFGGVLEQLRRLLK